MNYEWISFIIIMVFVSDEYLHWTMSVMNKKPAEASDFDHFLKVMLDPWLQAAPPECTPGWMMGT